MIRPLWCLPLAAAITVQAQSAAAIQRARSQGAPASSAPAAEPARTAAPQPAPPAPAPAPASTGVPQPAAIAAPNALPVESRSAARAQGSNAAQAAPLLEPLPPAPARAVVRGSFILPIEGDVVVGAATGIVVSVPSDSVAQVDFAWSGAGRGASAGTVAGGHLHQGRIDGLQPGEVVLVAIYRDGGGRAIGADSVRFRVRAESASEEAHADGGRLVQSFSLGVDLGWRNGLSQSGPIRYRALSIDDDSVRSGPSRGVPLDRDVTGSTRFGYQARSGPWHTAVDATVDLGENEFEQASHRVGLSAGYGRWAELRLGDQYPTWGPLLLDGNRVRGVGLDLAVVADGAQVATAQGIGGLVRRAVAPHFEEFETSDARYESPVHGTFDRYVFGGRLGFGSGRRWNWGLTALRVFDDTGSIDSRTQQALGGATPRDNFAAGSDLALWFFDRRLELYGQGALSFVTDNAAMGTVSDSMQEEWGLEVPGYLEPFLTINSSTRGTEKLLGENYWDFVASNAAARAGLRWNQRWSEGSSRTELRFVHTGSQFEVLTLGWRDQARTGYEWIQSAGLSRNRVVFNSRMGFFDRIDAQGRTIPEQRWDASLLLAPGQQAPGLHVDAGGQGSGDSVRFASRTFGIGGYWAIRGPGGTWTTNLGFRRTSTTSDFSGVDSLHRSAETRSYDGGVRYRTDDGRWTPRIGYQLFVDPGDPRNQTDHRADVGVERSLLSGDIVLDLGGGATYERELDRVGLWSQSFAARWSPGQDQQVRIGQRLVRSGSAWDVRIDAGWERYF